MQRENKPTNLAPIKVAAYIYLGAAFVYVMYSLITQTGLCGYLMDAQLRWFGVAYEKFTALIAFLILGAPASLIFSYIKRKESSTAGAPNTAVPVSAHSRPIAWKMYLIMCLTPTLIALPAYYILTRMDEKDQQREVYKVDLNHESALPSSDVKFVQLTGVLQLDYQYRLERESRTGSSARTNTFAPLTGPDWTKEQPVRFFINTTFSGYFDARTKRISSFPERGAVAATFDGKLTRNDLPTFVDNEYRRNGLLIESPYFVIDRMSFVDGRIPSAAERQAYYLIPILGVGLSMAILVGGSIGLAIRKLRRTG